MSCLIRYRCKSSAKEATMGTYMSAYLEFDYDKHSQPFTDPTKVYSLTNGSFAFDRGHEVFDALAGGRDAAMAPEDRDPRHAPLFAPRGMPSPCSAAVGWDYFHVVAEAPELPNRHFWPEHRCVSPQLAAEWLRNEGCHEANFVQWFNCGPKNRVWRVVSAPGLYNASWLRLNEFDAALKHHGLEIKALPIECRIVREAFSLLVEEHGPERVRLVVWFS
jgi:hypothetical protein